jgi:hypothetical protein
VTLRLSGKHRKTFRALVSEPVSGTIRWSYVEGLFVALGAELTEGRGSRVRVHLCGVRAVFHRPQPRKETGKSAVRSVRRFLEAAGIEDER